MAYENVFFARVNNPIVIMLGFHYEEIIVIALYCRCVNINEHQFDYHISSNLYPVLWVVFFIFNSVYFE